MVKAKKKTARKPAAKKTVRYPRGFDDSGGVIPLQFSATPRFAFAQLFVAAINTKYQLVYSNQTDPNGSFNKKWTPVNNNSYEQVAACTTLDGRVALVASEAKTNAIHYIAERPATSKAKGRWQKPEDLGLPPNSALFKTIAVARGVGGLDNVFGSTSLNDKTSIWWKFRNPPVVVTKKVMVTPPGASKPIVVTVQETEPPATPWSDWINITQNLYGGLSNLRVANNADGRIVLSGVYFNGIPWITQQTSENPFTAENWSGWVTPGAGAVETAGLITPILDSLGTVSAVVNCYDGLLRSRQTEPGGDNWSPYSLPGFIDASLGRHACSIDADGHLAIAVLNSPGAGYKNFIYFTQQTNAQANQWTSWEIMTMIDSATELEIDYNADGSLVLFAYDAKSGGLFTIKQINADSTEWEYFPTQIGTNIRSIAVTRDLTQNS